MTAADVAKMIEASVAKSLANAMKLVSTAEAPKAVAVPVPAAVAKRSLSPEQKAKMAEGRRKAAVAKAAPQPAAKAAPAAVPAGEATFTGHGQSVVGFTGVNKKGVAYKGIRFSDKYGRSFVCTPEEYHVLSCVIRSTADADIRTWLKG